jgi:hypothetical protein
MHPVTEHPAAHAVDDDDLTPKPTQRAPDALEIATLDAA